MRTKKSRPRRMSARRFLEGLVGPLTLGKVVRATREGDGISQTAFAKKLGISRSHLCDIERGRKPVSARKAARFARVLGYSEKLYVSLALQDALDRAGLEYRVALKVA